MAQTGYTPILIYASGTATNVPLAANLTSGASGAELALNYADGKLYYKDSGGVVQVLATKGTGSIGGSNTQVQYNSSGALAGSANLTFNGTTLTANTLNLTNALGTSYGGTGLTSFTANGVVYASSTSALATGSALTFDGNTLTATNTSGNAIIASRGGKDLRFSGNYAGANTHAVISTTTGMALAFMDESSEFMRLTSTGLGIGTPAPGAKLQVTTTGIPIKTTGPSSGSILQDIYVTRSSSGTTIQSGPNVTLSDGTSNNDITIQNSQGRFGVWNTSTGSWSERLILDSSGNLGLGVTPSAWATYTALQIKNGSIANYSPTQDMRISSNAYYNGTNWKRIAAAYATQYLADGSTGSHIWYNAGTSTADSNITFTQAMTLDASGNLGIGTTVINGYYGSTSVATRGVYAYASSSTNCDTAPKGLVIRNDDTTAGNLSQLVFGSLNTGNTPIASASIWSINDARSSGFSTGSLAFGTVGGSGVISERARIDSSGNLLVGATSSTYSSSGRGVIEVNGSSNSLIAWKRNGSASAYLYATSSEFQVNNTEATPMTFYVNGSERARIDSSGRYMVGTTTAANGASGGYSPRITSYSTLESSMVINDNTATAAYPLLVWQTATTGDNLFVGFFTEGAASITLRGSIDYNRAGGAVRYNTTSDATLKNLIGDAPRQKSIDILNSTRLREFSWKDDPTNKPQIGPLAQELYETYKGAVSVGGEETVTDNEGNEVKRYRPWAVDKTAFTFHLVAGFQHLFEQVQELKSELDSMKAELATLKGN